MFKRSVFSQGGTALTPAAIIARQAEFEARREAAADAPFVAILAAPASAYLRVQAEIEAAAEAAPLRASARRWR